MGMIFVNRDRQSLGQFTEQEISNALSSGEILPTDLAWKEGMETWQPVSTFTDLPPPGASPAPASVETGAPERSKNLTPNRQKPDKIQFEECLSKGWESFAKNWGACVAATMIFFVISIVIQLPMQLAQGQIEHFAEPKGGNPLMLAAAGGVFLFFWALASSVSMVLTAGFMYFFISALRTKANIGLVLSGFRYPNWIQILLAGGVWFAIIFALALVFMIPGGVLTATMKSEVPMIVFVVLFLVPLIYLSVGISFVSPLIVDYGMGFMEAIRTALKTAHRQWPAAFGLMILVLLLASLGTLPFWVGVAIQASSELLKLLLILCVGTLATTMPFAFLVWCQGYRQLFGDPDSAQVD